MKNQEIRFIYQPQMNTPSQKRFRMLVLLILLIAAWLVWSGIFNPLLLSLGLFSCLLTVYLAHRMGHFDNEVFGLKYRQRLLKYWWWLATQVIKSSLGVARIVINPRLPISPQVIRIRSTADNPVDQVILVNSITLTPGTLSIDVYDSGITVHSLTKAGADELLEGEMDRRVAALRED